MRKPLVVSGPPRRVAIVAASARSLAVLRGPLIETLVRRGIAVLCIAPQFTTDDEARLAALGAEREAFDSEPGGPRMLRDWRVSRSLAEIFKRWQADAVIAQSGRLMCLALIAGRGCGVGRCLALVNELPIGSADKTVSAATERIPERLLAKAFAAADVVVFHNRDQLRQIERAALLPPGVKSHVVAGAGVDLAHVTAMPLPGAADGIAFLMISTLDLSRGVLDYCAAARSLAQRAPNARFRLAGPAGTGPTGLSPDALKPFSDVVTFAGPLADVRPALADCHVFVYPSHGEGMPRAILEALAAGRPVITTTTPGCRDTVDDRVNGCLVAPGDVEGLDAAMASFLKRPDLLPAMSRASRLKAERHFDQRRVLETITAAIGLG
ncbi:MAG: glycosyltransferase [Hyphomicrobiaceae bacterium]|nr:glycosyltransferase [Hyphomicrobiaceae bacterium]